MIPNTLPSGVIQYALGSMISAKFEVPTFTYLNDI